MVKPNVEKMEKKKDLEGLIKVLKHKEESFRWGAAEALGRIGDARAVEPLIEALKDEEEYVRKYAAEALGNIGDARAVEPLIEALKDEEEYVRVNAAEALKKIGDTRAVEPLIEALKDEEEYVRRRAALALGGIGDTRAVEPLIEALKDKDEIIRWDATQTLGGIGDTRAVEPLIEALKDEDENVREHAVEALGKMGDARAVEPLTQLLKDKNEPEYVRWRAAEALGYIGDERAVEPLTYALKDKDKIVRETAAEALGGIGDAKAVEPLTQALKDKDKSVRQEAAEALKKIGDARAVEPLTQSLNTSKKLYGGEQGSIKCPQCDKMFRTPDELKKHNAVDHKMGAKLGAPTEQGIIKCPQCGKMFRTPDELKEHQATDHIKGAKPSAQITVLPQKIDKTKEEIQSKSEELIRELEPKGSTRAAETSQLPAGEVSAKRGGGVEGDKYVFRVSVVNNTPYVITNVVVMLTAYPDDCLSCEQASSEFRRIKVIQPGGSVSPPFELKPTKDCVIGTIYAVVNYHDHMNKLHEIPVEPHPIRMVCGLLKPLPIEEEEFKQLIKEWAKTDVQRELRGMNAKSVFERAYDVLSDCNFYIFDSHEEESVEGKFVGVIKGFAQGRYKKKRVGVELKIQGDVGGGGAFVSVKTLAEEEDMVLPANQNVFTAIVEKLNVIEKKQDETRETLTVIEKGVRNVEDLIMIGRQQGKLPILLFLAKEEAYEKEKEGSFFSRLTGFLVKGVDKMKGLVINELIAVPVCAHMGPQCEFVLSEPIVFREFTDFAHKLLGVAQIVLSFLPFLIQTFGPSAVVSKIGKYIGSSEVKDCLNLIGKEVGDKISEMKPATVKDLKALLGDSEKRGVLEYCFQNTREEWFKLYSILEEKEKDKIIVQFRKSAPEFGLCSMAHFICETCEKEGTPCPTPI